MDHVFKCKKKTIKRKTKSSKGTWFAEGRPVTQRSQSWLPQITFRHFNQSHWALMISYSVFGVSGFPHINWTFVDALLVFQYVLHATSINHSLSICWGHYTGLGIAQNYKDENFCAHLKRFVVQWESDYHHN